MIKKSPRQQIFTAVLRQNLEKWGALRKEMGVDGYDDPDSYDSIDSYFKAQDEHLEKIGTDPVYHDQWINRLEKFYIEWEKRGLTISIGFGYNPDRIEKKLYHNTSYFLDEDEAAGYILIRCEWCGEIFGGKKFSTTRYCTPQCKRAANNQTRNDKKGVIRNEVCANPACKKNIASKRAGAKTCSPACYMTLYRKSLSLKKK